MSPIRVKAAGVRTKRSADMKEFRHRFCIRVEYCCILAYTYYRFPRQKEKLYRAFSLELCEHPSKRVSFILEDRFLISCKRLNTMTWRTVPLRNTILAILQKRQGVIIDKELVRLLKTNRISATPEELDRALLELEIAGQIHVQQITKTKRKIELLGERRYLAGCPARVAGGGEA